MRRGQLRQADVVVAPARDPRARALREARRSGVLSLPARGLREFPHEAYHLEDHMDKASVGCLVPGWLMASWRHTAGLTRHRRTRSAGSAWTWSRWT
jgi:hypothetical protein